MHNWHATTGNACSTGMPRLHRLHALPADPLCKPELPLKPCALSYVPRQKQKRKNAIEQSSRWLWLPDTLGALGCTQAVHATQHATIAMTGSGCGQWAKRAACRSSLPALMPRSQRQHTSCTHCLQICSASLGATQDIAIRPCTLRYMPQWKGRHAKENSSRWLTHCLPILSASYDCHATRAAQQACRNALCQTKSSCL